MTNESPPKNRHLMIIICWRW